ncbi:MAG: ATPase [Alphaproteobacteria bacterium]
MLARRIRRFYKDVGVDSREDGVAITLDGRPVRTPGGALLAVSSPALARAIAAEWRAQGETVAPHTMPLTQLASTAIDRTTTLRGAIIDEVMAFAGTDLVCYRTADPPDLARRQAEHWQPLLDWVEARFSAPLRTTTTITAVPQPAESLAALRVAVEEYDTPHLTVVQCVAATCGSLVVALALTEGRIGPAEAFAAALVDETFQNERWGVDEEAARRHESLRADVHAAALFLTLLTAGEEDAFG